jgi:hypothetical protein
MLLQNPTSVQWRLKEIIEEMEKGLADAYKQDHSAFDRKMDHYKQIAKENGFMSIWNVFEVEDLTAPHSLINNELYYTFADCVQIEGDTWVDVYRAADKLIRRSGDEHHVFIEGFYLDKSNLFLITGS